MTFVRDFAFILIAIALYPSCCLAAEKRIASLREGEWPSLPRATIQINVSMVLVPVNVTTPLGRPVTHLNSKNFHLFEDNVEFSIRSFARDDRPVSVGVVFDCSGSMRPKIATSTAATRAFFKTANKEDEHFLVAFGDRPRLSIPFTGDTASLTARIAAIRPSGRTSLFDAIHLAMAHMKFAKNKRKAIVIFSDGGDNWSRKSLSDIRRQLLEADVQVYAVEIVDEHTTRKLTREEINAPKILDELTEITGGSHLQSSLLDLTTISELVGTAMRSQYVLGYMPTSDGNDGKYHRVKVTLNAEDKMPDLRLSHRPGYYSAGK